MATAALVVCMFVITSADKFVLSSSQYGAVIAAVLVDLTNTDRSANQIGGLTVNQTLVEAAQAKADDEASKGYFAHVAPDGKDSWYWFKQAGYSFSYAGENLAVDFSDSGDVNVAWMNSPTHRENILNAHFTEIGIATAAGSFQGHPTIFVVQMFGTPAQTAAVAAAAPVAVTAPAQATDIAIATKPRVVDTSANKVLGSTVTQKPITVSTVVRPAPADVVEKPSPATAVTTSASDVRYAPAWGYFVSSPRTMLLYLYYLLAGFILAVLVVTTGMEFRRHHRRKFAIAGGLLFLMCVLFLAGNWFVFGSPTIAASAPTTRAL